jgi:CDP-diacylglycerol--serine O-phosphatidyltransferase
MPTPPLSDPGTSADPLADPLATQEANAGPPRRPPRRGIYLLPNLLTTGSIYVGLFAIISATDGHFLIAGKVVFIAMVLDAMDGRIARLTNTQTAFGSQYDSLADMVSFGITPALVAYLWKLKGLGDLGDLELGAIAAFIYTTCAALRLARFNTQIGRADKRYFQGLASPAAAALVMGLVWTSEEYHLREMYGMGGIALAVTVVAGLLMVSNVRYHSMKDITFKDRVPFVAVIAIALGIAVISLKPCLILFGGAILYAGSGPILTLEQMRRHRLARRHGLPPPT